MDINDVIEMFCKITGVPAEDLPYGQLILNGIKLVRSRLCVPESDIDVTGIRCCEFAAAASAAYEYACIKAAEERPVMSENGRVSISRDFPEFVSNMKKLRDSAFEVLSAARLTGGGFAFTAV